MSSTNNLFLSEHPQAEPAVHGFTEKSCSRTFADTTDFRP